MCCIDEPAFVGTKRLSWRYLFCDFHVSEFLLDNVLNLLRSQLINARHTRLVAERETAGMDDAAEWGNGLRSTNLTLASKAPISVAAAHVGVESGPVDAIACERFRAKSLISC